jgi:hypothetical protein
MTRKKILILTTSVFTDRIFQHSTFLEEIRKEFDIEIWARSFISNAADWNMKDITVKAIPPVRPLHHWLNLLRRANEFAWMHSLPAKSLKLNIKYKENQHHQTLKLMKTAGWLIAQFKLHRWFEKILQRVIIKKSDNPAVSKLIRESDPDYILVSNPFWVEEPLIALEGIKSGIPIISLVPSWDNITTKSRMIYKSVAFGVWSAVRIQELHKYYPETSNLPVFIYGTPQYDIFKNSEFIISKQVFFERYSLDPAKPVILYTLGSPYFISSEITVCLDFCKIALKEGLLDKYQVLIRPHPAKDFSEFLPLFNEIDPRIKIQSDVQTLPDVQYKFQDKDMIKNWVSTFYYTDIVIATSSTTILDGSMMNKRHINIAANLTNDRSLDTFLRDISFGFEHLQTLNERKLLNNVSNFDELIGQLKNYLISGNSIPDNTNQIIVHLSEYENTGNYGKIFADQLKYTIHNHLN